MDQRNEIGNYGEESGDPGEQRPGDRQATATPATKVRHGNGQNSCENNVEDHQLQQRIEQGPAKPKQRSFVSQLDVTSDKLPDQVAKVNQPSQVSVLPLCKRHRPS